MSASAKDAESVTASLLAATRKAFQPHQDWKSKDELLDVVYWLRQVLGLFLGVAWAFVGFRGLIAIILFMAVNCAITYTYVIVFQRAQEESYGNLQEVLKEGLPTSFATFLAIWIVTHTFWLPVPSAPVG